MVCKERTFLFWRDPVLKGCQLNFCEKEGSVYQFPDNHLTAIKPSVYPKQFSASEF